MSSNEKLKSANRLLKRRKRLKNRQIAITKTPSRRSTMRPGRCQKDWLSFTPLKKQNAKKRRQKSDLSRQRPKLCASV